jgi:hypothetical protein
VAAFRIPTVQPIVGAQGSKLIAVSFDKPDELDTSKGIFISRADIFGSHFRVIFMNFVASAINKMWVVSVSPATGARLEANYPQQTLRDLDWDPVARNALRQPVLAEDCDLYAFLGRNQPRKDNEKQADEDFKVWIGQFRRDKAESVPIRGYLAVGSVAVGRGCGSVIVRDDSSKLHIVSIGKAPHSGEAKQSNLISVSLDTIPEEMKEILVPTFAQAQPLLAAAPIDGNHGWRVTWPTRHGLALIDVKRRGSEFVSTPVDEAQLLTGMEVNYASGSLSLSPDASFAYISTQQNFASQAMVRVFDLKLAGRRTEFSVLSDDALLERACQVARFQTGYNFLTHTELEIWLGSPHAPQPCTGKE